MTCRKNVDRTRRPWPIIALAAALAGCATTEDRVAAGTANARALAGAAGLEWEEVAAGRFIVATAHRGLGDGRDLVVYLEGDGRAWETRRRPADDPTPLDPVGLRLAARDTSPRLLYVARPCQFVGAAGRGGCEQRHWTSARYGEEVLDAVDAVVERAAGAGDAGLVLVGYSGGGTLAALLAARRTDVACLITVAANLDLDHWIRHHRLAPLSDSLDPAAMPGLAPLPQVHLAGADDARVPSTVLDSYLARTGAGRHALRRVIDGFDHECCWADAWPDVATTAAPRACMLPRPK